MGKLIIYHVHQGYELSVGKSTKVSIESPGVLVNDGIKGDATGFGLNRGSVQVTKSGSGLCYIHCKNGEYTYTINQVYATSETLPDPSRVESQITTFPSYPIWPSADPQRPQTGTTDATGNPAPLSASAFTSQFKQPLADLVTDLPLRLGVLRNKAWLFNQTDAYATLDSNDKNRVQYTWNFFRSWVGFIAYLIYKLGREESVTGFSVRTLASNFDAMAAEVNYGVENFYNIHNSGSWQGAFSARKISQLVKSGSNAGNAASDAYFTANTADLWNKLQVEYFEAAVLNKYTGLNGI